MDRKLIDYRLVTGELSDEFQNKVKNLLQQGYELYGPLVVSMAGTTDHNPWRGNLAKFAQRFSREMVKYE